jgi:hypothetical protein
MLYLHNTNTVPNCTVVYLEFTQNLLRIYSEFNQNLLRIFTAAAHLRREFLKNFQSNISSYRMAHLCRSKM